MSDGAENLVVPGNETHFLLPSKTIAPVAIKRGMPCLTILIHGVNDVGEAFPHQEKGLCAGLNTRLQRTDLLPGEWSLPLEKIDGGYTAADVMADPDKVYFQRKPDAGTSPIIPFYWGFREISMCADTSQKHGQYLDQYGNRIDKRYGKNGGPFANATTNIPDMFGPGFDRNWMIRRVDPESGTHPLESAPPRTYMILAAQRLASLLRIIRKKSPSEPINIVAHSQGCFVTLLAHAMLAKEGKGIKADTVILNNPPYSLEEPFAETFQSGDEQQTAFAREETLKKIVADYMTVGAATEPNFVQLKELGDGVVGKGWVATAKKERDNRGKVFLYFSPDDGTVGLPNIQGIGWWGVYEGMRKKLGDRFFQRLFASPIGSNPEAPAIGAGPQSYKISFKWNAGFTFSRKRFINGEPLEEIFTPDFGPALLFNGPIDAAIAVANRYKKKGQEGMLPSEASPEIAQARWLNRKEENSFHSSIVSNSIHSEKATSYDISIGLSRIQKANDDSWITFLRCAADWRTNWKNSSSDIAVSRDDPSFPPPESEQFRILNSEIDSFERDIIVSNANYYCIKGVNPGTLPDFTAKCSVESLSPYVVSETVKQVIDNYN